MPRRTGTAADALRARDRPARQALEAPMIGEMLQHSADDPGTLPAADRRSAAPQRMFFALWPDAAARDRLAKLAAVVERAGGGRATGAQNLHVTVAFLGQVHAAQHAQIQSCGARAAASVSAFNLGLERLGGTAQGISWIEPAAIPPALQQLHEVLARMLGGCGVTLDERRFRPHITLARRCTRPISPGLVAAVCFDVMRLSLVASALGLGGSTYRETASWPLGATPQPTATV